MNINHPYIDPKIRHLVACMNTFGLKTYASCQGHGFPLRRQLPYVAFKGPFLLVKYLAKQVREDAESPQPRMYWGWEVTASFNTAFELCYRLAPTNPRHYHYRYWRGSLDHDFLFLCQIMKRAFH